MGAEGMSFPRRWSSPLRERPVVGATATVALIALLMAVGEPLLDERVSDAAAHGISHLLVGLPLAALLVAAVRWWPPARRIPPGRLGRRLVVAGLAGMVLGSVLEVLGARVDEPDAWLVEGIAHTAGQVVATLSVLVTAVGAVAALAAATRDGAVPRWVAAAVTFGLVALLATVVLGAPGA